MLIPKSSMRMVDKGWSRLVRDMKDIKRKGESYAKAGVLGSTAPREDGDPLSNVDIAIVHEFGAPNAGIPERSFIRSTFNRERAKYIQLLRLLAPRIYADQIDATKALGLLGLRMAADMKGAIQGGLSPALSASTIHKRLMRSVKSRAAGRLARRRQQAEMAGAVFGGPAADFSKMEARSIKAVANRSRQMRMAAAVFGNHGGHVPLLDTGQLLNSITHAVVLGREEKKGTP